MSDPANYLLARVDQSVDRVGESTMLEDNENRGTKSP